jgi:glycosyltransferase involved in cell wall biosynthesis
MAGSGCGLDHGKGAVVVKRELMIAYHFPPMNVSSGVQRTLRFAQYLPESGWEPTVLSAHRRTYPNASASNEKEIPTGLVVRRAFALNTAQHLSLRGRYSRLLCVPDQWWTWWLGAVPAGLALIRRLKPDVLWSTYPIATAHAIGYTLHRLTGIPWVADFRDPMAQPGYPADPLVHRAFERIEFATLKHCRRAVFTAPGALRLYAERYPGIPRERLAVVENGYDESAFSGAEQAPVGAQPDDGALVLLHSGTIYESERDPRAFFAAIAELRRSGRIVPGEVRIVLRATGCDEYLRGLIGPLQIGDIVTLEPAVGYREALTEMLAADGLLVLQASNCNDQVPAKLYEYLRAGRPILALADPRGDTASVLRDAGIDTIAPLDSKDDIARLLAAFLDLVREHRAPLAAKSKVEGASRRSRTSELARILDAACS